MSAITCRDVPFGAGPAHAAAALPRRPVAAGLAIALLSVPLAGPAKAMDDRALYPAAQCAAFWFGWDDFARASTLLDRSAGDLARAEAFRQAALTLTTTGPEAVDAFIARQRPLMFAMIDDAILGNSVSADLMERLLGTCDDFAATRPELDGLR
jgi:hypothetical protein